MAKACPVASEEKGMAGGGDSEDIWFLAGREQRIKDNSVTFPNVCDRPATRSLVGTRYRMSLLALPRTPEAFHECSLTWLDLNKT